ncbi:MAG: chemotaxis protein CheA [Armatimonadetes bacterium]|nr:chemotaxis protein CheA [Armatimonadota bacterium]
MSQDHLSEDLEAFLADVEDQLKSLESGILQLEQSGGEPDLLRGLFRAAHTLKGASATFGYPRMVELTHLLESLLDGVSQGDIKVTSRLIDTLFKSLDALNALTDELVAPPDVVYDVKPLIAVLSELLDPGATQEAIAAPPETHKGAPEAPPTHSSAEREDGESFRDRALLALESGKGGEGDPYAIAVQWHPKCPTPAIRTLQLLKKLIRRGTLFASDPPMEEIENGQVGHALKLALLSTARPDVLESEIWTVPEVDSAQIALLTEPLEVPSDVPVPTRPAEDVEAPAPATEAKAIKTIRVDVARLDNLMNLVGELVIDRNRLFSQLKDIQRDFPLPALKGAISEVGETLSHVGRMLTDLQEEIMKSRMVPIDNILSKFPRMVRDLASKEGKKVRFTVEGGETELDRSILEEIKDPLIHILRNCVDHGIEPPEKRTVSGKNPEGILHLKAQHMENLIVLSIEDDGGGIDAERVRASAVKKGFLSPQNAEQLTDREALDLIFTPGFSTSEQVSEISGRGVGMDIVRHNLARIGGSLQMETRVGKGTRFLMKLPLTLAIIQSLLIRVNKRVYAIPLSFVEETLRIFPTDIQTLKNRETIFLRGKVLPLIRLSQILRSHRSVIQTNGDKIFVVVVGFGGSRLGLIVDSLIGEQEIVIKPLGAFLGNIGGISGATILSDGRVSLILDIPTLLSTVKEQGQRDLVSAQA